MPQLAVLPIKHMSTADLRGPQLDRVSPPPATRNGSPPGPGPHQSVMNQARPGPALCRV